jgi:hypothetical protein
MDNVDIRDYSVCKAKPRYLCRWWLKTRRINSYETNEGLTAEYEFYCPTWAKPLDFVWKLVFGNPILVKD